MRPAQLSAGEARRIALRAQGLAGARLTGGAAGVLGRLRAVQLDTISVLARSHELVAYARLGPVPRARIEDAYWGPRASTFEFWSHAACVLPLEDWPLYAARRRRSIAKGRRWHDVGAVTSSLALVRDRLRDEGPLSARQLGGAKSGGQWFEWSDIKIAAEWLLDTGEVVCRARRGFERVYDLAERAVPLALRETALDDHACAVALVSSASRALGVATEADLAAYHGLGVTAVRAAITDAGLEPVEVEGWGSIAFAAPGALVARPGRARGRGVLLSPFDSLIWDRARTERLFSLRYRLEAYVPAPKRVHGYYAMPVLAGDRIVGLVDPKRSGTTLVARHVVLHTADAPAHVAAALRAAAGWVGCDTTRVERVTPATRLDEVRVAVTAASD